LKIKRQLITRAVEFIGKAREEIYFLALRARYVPRRHRSRTR
jgi:hypothetical protein